MYDFSVGYNSIEKYDITNIRKYLMIKNNIRFSLIKQVFMVLLIFSSSLSTTCVSLNDEPRMARPTLIDLNPVELKYCPFMVSLDKCNGSCNVLSPNMCPEKNKRHKCKS